MQDLSQVLDQAADLHRRGELAAAEGLYLQVLKARPDHFDALQMLGILRYQQRRCQEALSLFGSALQARPDFPPTLLNYGLALAALERRNEALASYDKALAIQPDYVEALYKRGLLLRSLKRPADALASFDKALAVRPDYPETHYHRGQVLRDLQRSAQALAAIDRALSIKPDYVEALNFRGIVLQDLQRPAEALASFDKALAVRPDYATALNNRGNILQELKRPAEALASYDMALAIQPAHAPALYNRGIVLRQLQLPAEALISFDRALAITPDHVDALNNRGVVLRDLRRPAEALASYDTALSIKPNYVEALNNRGSALRDLRRLSEALASHDQALAINPRHADTLCNRGVVLRDMKRFGEALASFEQALTIDPGHRYAFAGTAYAALAVCDWARTATIAGELERHIAQRSSIIPPFTLLSYGGDPALQLECAKWSVESERPAALPPPGKGAARHDGKLRIAYLSADFRRHPVASLIAELIELHDRARFEIVGISFGPDDQSDMRARLVRAFDGFHDVRSKGDLDVAKLVNDLQVDIAIDLSGHTENARLGILAHRPAPVQVSYLGYASTTGASFIDYVIADEIVLPFDQQPFYTEKIVHLPDCFLVNDATKPISSSIPTRRDAGLPDDGFVFCSFNNTFKITPSIFDVWMRLLKSVKGSVLWLSDANDDATGHLRGEAAAQGVDPARLIFAPKLERLEDHLARHRLAGLFLDTLPYNAHTTASEALWAGLPLLTCLGTSFAGRVAASLLHAAGLPELVTNDFGEYEELALRLATDASLLLRLRNRLERNRATCPLFDTDRFRRHIERAYGTMWEIQRRGDDPRSFSVDPLT
jgi:predicted O-linked N-acetylglucosamine transferase (SPINDLY family)